MSYKIISVGGSIVIPQTGFDVQFLKDFRDLILEEVKNGQRFLLIIGGGGTARNYQSALREAINPSDEILDWIGIHTTRLNAQLVRLLFGTYAYKEVVLNPHQKIVTTKPIIVGAGFEPGCSTDTDAVFLAKTFKAKEVINLSNIDYVYDSDPRANPNARRLEEVTWPELRQIVGERWTPGANVPFDPIAAKLAQKLKLKVSFVKGTDLAEVGKAVRGERARGTKIS